LLSLLPAARSGAESTYTWRLVRKQLPGTGAHAADTLGQSTSGAASPADTAHAGEVAQTGLKSTGGSHDVRPSEWLVESVCVCADRGDPYVQSTPELPHPR